MSERQDDTTQPGERDAPPEPERAPGNYYYDDGTGYEVYDPATDDDETSEDETGQARDSGKISSRGGAFEGQIANGFVKRIRQFRSLPPAPQTR